MRQGILENYEKDVHIIGFQPIVDNALYVHHMLIRMSESDDITSCNTNDISSPLHVWASGGSSLLLPFETGFKLGPTGIKRFLVSSNLEVFNT